MLASRMRRVSWLFAVVVAALIACAATACGGDQPNVILILSDDQGVVDIGALGANDLRTPTLDRFVTEGVYFRNAYVAAPVCSPSRAALLTGRYPIRAGVPTNAPSRPGHPGMPTSEVTIAELLRDAGYRTALFGKWHLGTAPGYVPNDQGFDEFFGFHAGCVDYWSHYFYWATPHFHDLWRNRREVHYPGRYLTDLIAEAAIEFVRQVPREQPFFIYLAFNAPHYPMQAPQRDVAKFLHVDEPRRTYAAMLHAMDRAIGDLLDVLDSLGRLDETVVFFLSDHGATLEARAGGGGGNNGPYRGHKFSLFDGGIRTPMLAWAPRRFGRGIVRDSVVMSIDLYPTIAELAGADLPKGLKIDGRSIVDLLQPGKHERTVHDALFWELGPQKAVRRGPWKLVVRGRTDTGQLLRGPDEYFLSNLVDDPGERHNLAAKHPELVRELLQLHEAWSKDVRAQRAD